VRLWIAYGGDPDRLDERLYPRVLEVVAHYARGTLHGIGCDDDGLIAASSPHHALTWMDACVDGAAVTPRRGKPVEIQALWYNALCVAADLAMARRKTELAGGLRALAQRTANTFRARFWMPALGYCADVVDPHEAPAPGVPFGPGTTDERMRPNQLFAASLGHTMLLPAERERLVDAVRDELLTPRGLRTLAPGASGYRARFEGGPRERDEGYHQGAVWPWLLGPYARALVSARGSIDAARQEARAALEPVLARAIEEHCLGQIAEVYDSEAPQRAAGCPAQAMSVAEVLRAWLEIVEGRGPAAGVRPGRFDVTRIELVDLA